MNIFENYLNLIIKSVEKNKKKLGIKKTNNFEGVISESPPPNYDYDLSTNIALILGKKNNLNPKDLCNNIKELLIKEIKDFLKIDVAGPGFLNIKLTNDTLKKIILNIFKENSKYGSSNQKHSYNIEFVSANPTGPMHVGHCRGAIFGDVLANLLSFNGNKVTKEYYINDYGNQIINFTKSVFLRIREIKFKESFVNHKDLYPGQYIIDIAKEIIKENPDIKFKNFNNSYEMLSKKALDHSMRLIKDDLNKLGIKHDFFFSEKDLVKKKLVEKSIEILKKNKFVVEGYLKPPKGEESKDWKKIKRLIFKSSIFGDDSDRALQKNDGSWTYFANDVAYHSDKISRKYNYLINILGADHTGYTKRINAAVEALSKGKTKLTCKVCQLVKLYKKGKPFKMSKRSGEFISVGDLLKEVDKDSIRFMMLNRSNDVELDFDFDKVLEKNKDNPVFYVQYCYARICSLFRSINLNEKDPIKFEDKNFNLNQFENKILRKIYDWPKIIETSAHKLEPHRIPFYLYDLATLFHSYWSKGNENDDFKFLLDGRPKNLNTIAIIKLIFIVLQNGMKILNVSLPKKM
tara:strand:+ start:26 stop:1750 length:1725 start_codon:yes stop_codon:yes gene_type:complete